MSVPRSVGLVSQEEWDLLMEYYWKCEAWLQHQPNSIVHPSNPTAVKSTFFHDNGLFSLQHFWLVVNLMTLFFNNSSIQCCRTDCPPNTWQSLIVKSFWQGMEGYSGELNYWIFHSARAGFKINLGRDVAQNRNWTIRKTLEEYVCKTEMSSKILKQQFNTNRISLYVTILSL